MSFEIDERPFADLVFHVLAHVPSDVPASVYDPAYIAFAARHLGPATSRSLADDVAVLRHFAADHAGYARLQSLSWLFDDLEQFAAAGERDLAALGPADVADASLLAAFGGDDPAVEFLRCASLLECDGHAALPPAAVDRAALALALAEVSEAAPELASHRVASVRALGLRGRVRKGEIWVGAPRGEHGPSLAHLAWQAAHEATVARVEAHPLAAKSSEREREAVAVVLLGARAERAGLGGEHAAWFQHFGGRAGPLDPARLSSLGRDAFDALLAG